MSRISKSQRISLWLERLNRFSQANQSVAEFCSDEGISTASLYRWKQRLSPSVDRPKAIRIQSPALTRSNFAEVSIAPAFSAPTQVHLPHGVTIELGSDQAIAASVVGQVLLHCLAAAIPAASSSKASSC